MFSHLEPEKFAQKLIDALKSVQIAPKDAKKWSMNYLVTKSDREGNLIADVSCEVQLQMFRVKGSESFVSVFTKSAGHR